jgi:transposase-like protein
MNLIDIPKTFKTDDECMEHLAKLRWPDGVRCVTCGTDKVKQYASPTAKQPNRKIYQCSEPSCQQQFSATAGTIFHDTHLPLTKWFMALSLIVDAKKSISAKQLQRHLKTGYKTAWYLAHRIRKAMEETGSPLLSGTVEMDETYIGGRSKSWQRYRSKDVVVGVRQRGGPLRFIHAEDATIKTLREIAEKHVSPDVELFVTDELPAYHSALRSFRGKHRQIRHKDRVYVRGDIHTNTVESSFSLLKRGITGSFHSISIKHLHRYLAEFEFRFNRRERKGEPKQDIFTDTLRRMAQVEPMPFAVLTAQESQESRTPEPF